MLRTFRNSYVSKKICCVRFKELLKRRKLPTRATQKLSMFFFMLFLTRKNCCLSRKTQEELEEKAEKQNFIMCFQKTNQA
jgi:hypothetical protein